MVLQEQFERDYPDKEEKRIFSGNYKHWDFTNWDLDLSGYVNLEVLSLDNNNKITSLKLPRENKIKDLFLSHSSLIIELDLSQCKELNCLDISSSNFTSISFLNNLPNPEKLERLRIYDNNIKPTNIEIFSKFVNVKILRIGTSSDNRTTHNQFYGSLKSWKNLIKLEEVCIGATNVSEGLEYLPTSLVQNIAREDKKIRERGGYVFQCYPNKISDKCKAIQDQLRKCDYDIEAWQLAHPAEMFRARPELFASGDSKEKWLSALDNKIEKTQEKLKEIKQSNPDKVKKIKRLNTKLGELNIIKQLLEERTIFEDSLSAGVKWYDKFKEDKATQTETKTQDQETQTEELLEYKIPSSWPKK